jgi:hypothetical protein
MSAGTVNRKRKSTLEDSFSDIEIDDLELDEDDFKQLERIESPNKLPNGNYKCNHLCKDKTKSVVLWNLLMNIDVDICVAKKAKFPLENKGSRFRKRNRRNSLNHFLKTSRRIREALQRRVTLLDITPWQSHLCGPSIKYRLQQLTFHL